MRHKFPEISDIIHRERRRLTEHKRLICSGYLGLNTNRMNPPLRPLPILSSIRNQFQWSRENNDNNHHIKKGIDWLCTSQDVGNTGGSAASYNLFLGWAKPYPETTGYIIPTLYRYHDFCADESAAQRATDMAKWLIQTQYPNGSFPGSQGEGGDPTVFNTGQIIFGLIETYRRTGDQKYKTAALDAADWLISVQSEDGMWIDCTFNDRKHAYHTRVSWALAEAAKLETEKASQYKESARLNLQWAAQLQQKNGWFAEASFNPDRKPFLHTISYTTRGLLECGDALDNDKWIETAKVTADAVLDIHNRKGVLKGEYNAEWEGSWYYCLPGNCQMAIVWLRLFEFTGNGKYLTAAEETIEFLKTRQLTDGPSEVNGALPGSYPIFGKYIYFRFPNWGVKFFLDMLMKYEQIQKSGTPRRKDE